LKKQYILMMKVGVDRLRADVFADRR